MVFIEIYFVANVKYSTSIAHYVRGYYWDALFCIPTEITFFFQIITLVWAYSLVLVPWKHEEKIWLGVLRSKLLGGVWSQKCFIFPKLKSPGASIFYIVTGRHRISPTQTEEASWEEKHLHGPGESLTNITVDLCGYVCRNPWHQI